MKTNKEKRGAMEILWLCMGVLCLIIAIASSVENGLKNAGTMFVCSGVCFMMFSWRQHLRKNRKDD
ncbi:MAG: hypothetical protein IIU03_04460 [Bacteroidales bacterium]|jgi:hypothetical protein|nr:hypothetical protein [Bacteroidales bacterium]MBQ5539477.1 hypothetical protein [Bacteroidales bacterium]MBR4677157.1 hypothetical protein [Bacteroidales bacterium]MEE3448681.1 hypothetical protein [Bacteroidales bacterium]